MAPFHVLAAEGSVVRRSRPRLAPGALRRLAAADPDRIRRTERRFVDLTDPATRPTASAWWEELTAAGGEGMVVKPLDFIASGRRASSSPASSAGAASTCGSSTAPSTTRPRPRPPALPRPRPKRSLASREFALGVEALERFVRGEPLYRVHECVFGVLALESEPVDPRL